MSESPRYAVSTVSTGDRVAAIRSELSSFWRRFTRGWTGKAFGSIFTLGGVIAVIGLVANDSVQVWVKWLIFAVATVCLALRAAWVAGTLRGGIDGAVDAAASEERREAVRALDSALIRLGDSNIAARAGAVRSLERVARVLPDQRATVSEALADHIRTASGPAGSRRPQDVMSEEGGYPIPLKDRAPDIQAALTALGRPPIGDVEDNARQTTDLIQTTNPTDTSESSPRRPRDHGVIDLSGADLRAASLSNLRFRRAYMRFTDYRGADLTGAQLLSCNLRGARFTGILAPETPQPWAANLTDADLTGSDCFDADFTGGILDRTKGLAWDDLSERRQ